AVALLVAAVGFLIGQSCRLVFTATHEQTDFSVFFRTARELAAGADGTLYSRPDAPTGWPQCAPPITSVAFLPLQGLSIGAAAGVWAAVNLGLLGVAAWAIWRLYAHLDRQHRLFRATRLWAAVLLLSLANGCLQTGQVTILLVTCWLSYLAATARRRHFLAALGLALPVAMKFYPGLMWAIPVGIRARRQLILLPAALALFSVVIPLLVYGPRAWDLSRGYVEAMFIGDVPRLETCFDVNRVSTESLDVLLLRWLTHDPVWHEQVTWFPHLRLPRRPVLALANVLRGIILLVAGLTLWRYRPEAARRPVHGALMLAALSAATLYLTQPDPKSRYALYAFPAFLPLLAWTTAAWRLARRRRAVSLALFTILCAVCIAQLTPTILRYFEVSLLATFAVWLALVRHLTRITPRRSCEPAVPAAPPPPAGPPPSADEPAPR
ncbi:MAG: DUF2029 domain-containing protein, partial [Armatimonadetes bacterium]|nr:DUF2029 domain-containing protein [Armatimonadota bacterium]